MWDDVGARYEPLIKQIAALYRDDETLYSQIQATTVVAEEWDDNRAGGHLRLEASRTATSVEHDAIDACATDEDGTPIEIILHVVNGRISWGEWYRVDIEPIVRWPPSSVRRSL